MNPLRSFDEFLADMTVKKQRTDRSRASSLAEESRKRITFLNEMKNKIGIRDDNANYFVEMVYDSIMELIRAKMFIDGFSASGVSAHEAEISYLRKLGFSEYDIRFLNDLRYFRNGIVYYGKSRDAAYAKQVMEFLSKKRSKLEQLSNS